MLAYEECENDMEGNEFPYSTQNVSGLLNAEKDMGEYFPQTGYTSKADFEALGCADS